MLKEISKEEAFTKYMQEEAVSFVMRERLADMGAVDLVTFRDNPDVVFFVECLQPEKVKAQKIPKSKKTLNEDEVRKLYVKEGKSPRNCANQLGVTLEAFMSYLVKHGIDRNNPADYPDTRSKAERETK